MEKLFAGFDGFLWFLGVVESRQDPLGLGRVKVRIFGVHTESLTEIPLDNLPWASVSHGVNTRNSFEAPHEGDAVWGFFADGRNGQLPIVCGVVPGYFTDPADQGSGFHDLRTDALLKQSPRKVANLTYNTDGSGIKIKEIDLGDANQLADLRHPQPDEMDSQSIPQIATGQDLSNTVIQYRKTNLDKLVPTTKGGQWSEPYPAFNPLYPYNNATQTESGHVFELDDTPGNERIHIAHRNGSFIEWFPSGTRVEKVTKSKYSITMADDHVHIMGKCQITISGKAQIKVVGDCDLEVGGNFSTNVAGTMDVSVGGALNFKAASINQDIAGDHTIAGKTIHISSSGEMDITSGGDMNRQAGGAINDNAGGNWLAGGSYASVTASLVQLNGAVTAEQGGTPPGSASAGKATGIPAAIAAGKPTNATVPNEVAPTPLTGSLIDFDPETGLAFRQSQFLEANANTGQLVDPGANTAAVANAVSSTNSSPCMFDVTSKTFLTSDAWDISSVGLSLIQSQEGFAKVISPDTCTSYPDPVTGGQPFTIGYGSTAPGIGSPVPLGLVWSRSQAQANLQLSVDNQFLPALKEAVTVNLTQNMVDALLSLIYNIGAPNFKSSTLVQKLNNSDWCGAADQFLVWNKSNHGTVTVPGLTTRRKVERTRFLT